MKRAQQLRGSRWRWLFIPAALIFGCVLLCAGVIMLLGILFDLGIGCATSESSDYSSPDGNYVARVSYRTARERRLPTTRA